MTLAFKAMPAPDWAEATTITIPSVPTHTSEEWAQAVFDVRNVPAPVLAMFWLRERVVGLLGIAKGRPDTFAVDKIADGEALIEADEKHLRFVASVQADNDAGLLHVATAVELKNRAGRIYFAPVQVLHGVITRAMMTSARKRLCT
ncbi:DUF2867 domain-containing protein [uncultured Rhodococcus sp.]|uniref:DUF2867 domain-containing protein n=1 Tax=uncultured Rhodococcus sp. TaxID=194249 RepID=UPI0028DD355B|nr:DUF2867 domain-containing protein [uncultured Rhodococcus sp.]